MHDGGLTVRKKSWRFYAFWVTFFPSIVIIFLTDALIWMCELVHAVFDAWENYCFEQS